MTKLYFRYGCVTSSKTLNLLSVAHNYTSQNKNVYIFKPKMDDRFGEEIVMSKCGLNKKADLLIDNDTDIINFLSNNEKVDCILVDEVQFLDPKHIVQLRLSTSIFNIPIICYGLLTDFKTNLFPGSKRLIEICDTLENVKTTCFYCNKKGVLNLKHHGDKIVPITDDQNSIELGSVELYSSVCFNCYNEKTEYFNR